MTKILQGNFSGEGKRLGIVISRFNEFITSKLLGGALDALERHGVKEEDITVAWVPGAFDCRSWRSTWHNPVIMMLFWRWDALFAALPPTLIMWPLKRPKALAMSCWIPECPSCSVS